MEKPNIFNYATKELSQDAFFAWLLMCSKDDVKDEEMRKKGKAFVKLLFGNGYTVDSVFLQEKKIDLLVILRDENGYGKQVAAIIEDKTTSFLRDNQMVNYCEKLSGPKRDPNFWSNLKRKYPNADVCGENEIQLSFCKYIRSDYLYAREERLAKEQLREIKKNITIIDDEDSFIISNDKLDGLFSTRCGNLLFDSFVDYYEEKIKKAKDAIEWWDSKDEGNRDKSLFTHIGQTQFFNAAFDEESEKYYDLGSDMGWPWTAYDIVRIHPKRCDSISYNFRSDFCYRNGKRLCFEQHRDEKEDDKKSGKKDIEVKIGDLRRAVDISDKIIHELKQVYRDIVPEMKIEREKINDYAKGKLYNKKTIFCIGFGKDISSLDIAGYARAFTEKFRGSYNSEI